MNSFTLTTGECLFLIPLLQQRLIDWEGVPLPKKYKYKEGVTSTLQKVQSGEVQADFSKVEQLMIRSCINGDREIRYKQLESTIPGTQQRKDAENNIDMAKDILEKTGYYKKRHWYSFENHSRFRDKIAVTNMVSI